MPLPHPPTSDPMSLSCRLEDLPRSGADTEEKDREPKASDHAGSPVRARSAGPREGSLPSSEASKRVVELESLVQALKRVVDKQKTEMDRAHKTHDRLRQQKAELLRQLAEAQGRPGCVLTRGADVVAVSVDTGC
jgi:hypothetical protein